MQFRAAKRSNRSAEAGLLPMINVVFLLLVFFLIVAKLAPPEAFEITLPEATAPGEAGADGRFVLLIGPEGALGFGTVTGDGTLAALAMARAEYCAQNPCADTPPRLLIRADAAAPAARLAGVMGQITGLGFAGIDLVAVAP